jgi:hypothetical protein
MEPEVSLPCSQDPSTGPYPEPDQSIQYHPSCLSKIHFNIILPIKINLIMMVYLWVSYTTSLHAKDNGTSDSNIRA